MKDSKINSSINLAIKIAAILLIIGGAWQMLQGHEKRIEKVEVIAHANEGDVRDLKKDVNYIVQGIDEIKRDMVRKNE